MLVAGQKYAWAESPVYKVHLFLRIPDGSSPGEGATLKFYQGQVMLDPVKSKVTDILIAERYSIG